MESKKGWGIFLVIVGLGIALVAVINNRETEHEKSLRRMRDIRTDAARDLRSWDNAVKAYDQMLGQRSDRSDTESDIAHYDNSARDDTAELAEKAHERSSQFAITLVVAGVFVILGLVLTQRPTKAVNELNPLQTGDLRKCPFCAELVKQEARVCRYCGRAINPQSETSVATEEQIEELWRKSGIGKAIHSQTLSSLQREPQFYVLQGNAITGPFDKERLLELRKFGDIGDDDLVRRDGVEGWTRLAAITDLKMNDSEAEK